MAANGLGSLVSRLGTIARQEEKGYPAILHAGG